MIFCYVFVQKNSVNMPEFKSLVDCSIVYYFKTLKGPAKPTPPALKVETFYRALKAEKPGMPIIEGV